MKKVMIVLLSTTIGALAGALGAGRLLNNQKGNIENKVDKFKRYYNILNQWLSLKQEGKSLAVYFENNNYKSLAIYGMGELGNRLYDELKNSDIAVKYAIDEKFTVTYTGLDVRSPEEEFDKVDAIIVTAVFAFEEIEKQLKEKVDFSVISLEDVVYAV